MGGRPAAFVPRALATAIVVAGIAVPLPGLRAAAPGDAGAPGVQVLPAEIADPARPAAARFVDPSVGIAITPPPGWVRGPATALNPLADPPEPVQEVARFQVRVGDTQLYAAPIPITSGLVEDAVAILSIGVARAGSDVLDIDRGVRGAHELGSVPGFTALEDDATYEGLRVVTRYLFSRDGDRVLVARAAALEDTWALFEPALRAALLSFGGDPFGPNAPAAVAAPSPASPAALEADAAPDPTVAVRNAIIERAASLLGLRYVWGGNSTTNGMDCSAYVSWTWDTPRYTTDSIWNVSFPISKDELRPGDALDLTTGRDPQHFGHIRLFDAWANPERTALWVYEETPPRVVHRVVAYDTRYQPIRLAGLSGAGEARLVPGVAQTEPAFAATAPRATPGATRRPTRTITLAPTRRPATPLPSPTPWVRATPRPTASPSHLRRR